MLTRRFAAFPLIGATWNLGCVMYVFFITAIIDMLKYAFSFSGPMLGGSLSRPAKQWPLVFTHPVFRKYVGQLSPLIHFSVYLFIH